ncbi:MAG: hypothetical protein CL678_15590 [Bdellovibrionaceae bacterium]|nr:hypothetical protein [Pseudobdellovibrionaceae bacterium]|tara:strand:- start:264 stop:701 length:438 start_codon:yes stop_codon:yes gene_type:complete
MTTNERKDHKVNAIGDMAVSRRCMVFAVLAACAAEGRTITYGQLAVQIGLPPKGNNMGMQIGTILRDVFMFCVERDMPYMTSLVVYKSGGDRGIPGGWFWQLVDETLPEENTGGVKVYTNATREQKRSVLPGMQENVYKYFAPLV